MNSTINTHWTEDIQINSSEDIHEDIYIDLLKSKSFSVLNTQILSQTFLDNKDEDNQKGFEFDFPMPKRNMSNPISSFSKKSITWLGTVLDFNGLVFNAKLKSINESSETYELAEFEIDEVSASDLELLQVGAQFYWSVGFFNTNGQIKKESSIRFQRIIDWTNDDYDNAIDEAKRVFDIIQFK